MWYIVWNMNSAGGREGNVRKSSCYCMWFFVTLEDLFLPTALSSPLISVGPKWCSASWWKHWAPCRIWFSKYTTKCLFVLEFIWGRGTEIKNILNTLLQGQTFRGIYVFPKGTIFAVEVAWMHQEHREHLDIFWQSLDFKKKKSESVR